MRTRVHLVEIDPAWHSGCSLSPQSQITLLHQRQLLVSSRCVGDSDAGGCPTIPIPLLAPDADVPLDLSRAIHLAYEEADYDLTIDYGHKPRHQRRMWNSNG